MINPEAWELSQWQIWTRPLQRQQELNWTNFHILLQNPALREATHGGAPSRLGSGPRLEKVLFPEQKYYSARKKVSFLPCPGPGSSYLATIFLHLALERMREVGPVLNTFEHVLSTFEYIWTSFEHIETHWKTCLRYAQDTPKICQRYAQDMQENCTRYAWEMTEICPRYAKDMPKICTRTAQDMPEKWLRYAQDMPKICQRYAQDMHENCTRYAWEMTEICPRYA